ncbi:hemerythrin domain-containing protein [Maricaulis sp. CAU 1757]
MGNATEFKPIEPIPLDLLREPLVWFFAEHYRHRDACFRLTELRQSDLFDDAVFQDLHDFLDRDLPLHVLDEEDDLFPLMLERCKPDDRIESVLDMLSAEHANDMSAADAVKALLVRALADRSGLARYADAGARIDTFCRQQHRHIAVENAVVLPIARRRLTEGDLVTLGRHIAARRGLADPFEATA